MFTAETFSEGRFRYAQLTVSSEAVVRELERFAQEDFSRGMTESPYRIIAQTFKDEEIGDQQLVFVDLGMTEIGGHPYSVWTQAMRPPLSEKSQAPAAVQALTRLSTVYDSGS
ncbi:MAG: hypothetical protein TR69_WS6001000728 [candidate division WS6 bacterium OLB20]|uniref:Uncharacterized protein n=1 Tax=candidate division WS6 bacterium OLB20 TaxID=1617426 RepID=A0A136LYG4_9BACT|nr:MAG: hypothetical protein TR69_WS6001000728 [candidate division WS6 bacterium OLB20]